MIKMRFSGITEIEIHRNDQNDYHCPDIDLFDQPDHNPILFGEDRWHPDRKEYSFVRVILQN